VPQAWTVKDRDGHVLACFTAASRLDVVRKLVRAHYDAFRLHVSSSYREMFDRDLAKVLAQKHWRVVRSRSKAAKWLPGEGDRRTGTAGQLGLAGTVGSADAYDRQPRVGSYQGVS